MRSNPLQIKITKLTHGGAGLGELGGKKIFVPYSAPGDFLDIQIVNDHESFAEGKIISIAEPSACRVSPPCPVFGKCGGCQWQHINYRTQLEWKKNILTETLERIGGIKNPIVLDTLPSPKEWHYRNRIQLHVDSKGNTGFYRPKSKEVVVFDECAIADERLNKELNARRAEFSSRDRGIALRVEDGPAFSQINSGQNERIKETIAEWLKDIPHRTILELYAGAGNFTFTLAKTAWHVIASDIDGRAIKFAREEQKRLGANNIEFICAPAAKAARKFSEGCDLVFVDPPRKGCAEAIDAILSLKPKAIIYVSCDPATLARDVLSFSKSGYKLEKTLPVDMFPQTYHIESVSMLVSGVRQKSR